MSEPHTVSEPLNPLEMYRRLQMAEGQLQVARVLLREIEWSATGGVSGVGCCPICWRYDPKQADSKYWHAGYHGSRAGHSEGCDLAIFLEGKEGT